MTRVERINTDFSQQPFRGKHNALTSISGISVIPIEHTEARSMRPEESPKEKGSRCAVSLIWLSCTGDFSSD
jgi:hypothetical protein